MPHRLDCTSKTVGLKINISITHYMTNLIISEPMTINQDYVEQVSSFEYLGYEFRIGRDNQTCEITRPIGFAWIAFGKLANVLKSTIPNCLKRKLFVQCLLTNGLGTLTLTKTTAEKIKEAQRRMEEGGTEKDGDGDAELSAEGPDSK